LGGDTLALGLELGLPPELELELLELELELLELLALGLVLIISLGILPFLILVEVTSLLEIARNDSVRSLYVVKSCREYIQIPEVRTIYSLPQEECHKPTSL
jgi:hypothetical protein